MTSNESTSFWNPLRNRPLAKKLVGNSSWILFDKAFRAVLGFAMTAAIANKLGTEGFGRLQFVMSVAGIAQLFSSLGLESLVQSLISKNPEKRKQILTNALILRVLTSVIGMALALIWWHLTQSSDVLLLLLGIWSMFFLAFDIVESEFHAELRSDLSVKIRGVSLLIATLLRVWALFYWPSPETFFFILSLELAFGSLGLVRISFKRKSLQLSTFDMGQMKRLLIQATPMIVLSLSALVLGRLDMILLSQFAGKSTLGIYSVAVRLTEVLYIIPTALMTSSLSLLSQNESNSQSLSFKKRGRELMMKLSLLSWILVVLGGLLSQYFIPVFFGERYAESAHVLQVYLLGLPFVFVGTVRNSMWIAQNKIYHWMKLTLLAVPFMIAFYYWGALQSQAQLSPIPMAWMFVCSQAVMNWLITLVSPKEFWDQCLGLTLLGFFMKER